MEKQLQNQRDFFNQGKLKSVQRRKEILLNIKSWILGHQTLVYSALGKDLNKHEFETLETEIMLVVDEINYYLKNLKRLSAKKSVTSPLVHFKSRSYTIAEPLGLALIIAPWNYPFQLALAPLVSAIAAGNAVALKPSELAPHTAELIAKMFKELDLEDVVSVHQGGVETSTSLLAQRFDFIFFTGSSAVGKIVMEAAAKNLTPLVLELGGKSPCIVDKTASITLAAKRIIWGKFVNAGQTCVAPDYLLVDQSIKDDLVLALVKEIKNLDIQDMAHIINEDHFKRLSTLVKDESILYGDAASMDTLAFPLHLVDEPKLSSKIMKEEIFGPLLPIISFQSLDEVISLINSREKPLALYLFTNNKSIEEKIVSSISFGGGCINDTLIHLSNSKLPFGGVGQSGMGAYHGEAGFRAFSHRKSIMAKTNRIDIPVRYSPYMNKIKLLKHIVR